MDLLKRIARELDGMKNGQEPSDEIKELARDNNIVIAFGYSDDNVEFRGAIDDEYGAWEGTVLYIDGKTVIEPNEYDFNCAGGCKLLQSRVAEAKRIVAKFDDDKIYCWKFETDIPHECFDILDENLSDGEKFCRGIVFSLDDSESGDEQK